MPLIVISGQPCSGKSTIAASLQRMLQDMGQDTHVVDEPSLHMERNKSYADNVNEKITRGRLKSAVERLISKKAVVILDHLNNIKGYRYELWCVARAAGTRYCVIHVNTDVQQCRDWNGAREASESYSIEIFDDLSSRFERPASKNRWDSPLFTVRPGEEDEPQVLEAVVRVMTEADTAGQASMQAARDLAPTFATSQPATLGTNVLHEIDTAAQEVITAITEAQSAAAGGPPGLVRFGTGLSTLQIDRLVTLAELRRHKRAFLKLATKILLARLKDAETAKRMFIDYLRDNLGVM